LNPRGIIKLSNIILSANIKNKALELGYDSCGITTVDLMGEYASHLDERIRSFPESHVLYESLYPLAFPQKNVEWAKSIIVCIRGYGKYRIPERLDRYIGKAHWSIEDLSIQKNTLKNLNLKLI
jgi:epoxyqueuosine reductase